MWRKLKKIDWAGGPIDLIVIVLFIAIVAVWSLRSGEAQEKIQEFNTITQTWSQSKP